jgi:thiosulfate/3-mercaptopyruvate sulfurtransferase
MPGAVHLDYRRVLDQNDRFRTVAELRDVFAKTGVSRETPSVVYCYSGARSSAVCFALELAGYPAARHYYFGWYEWSASPQTPAVTSGDGQ